MLLAILLVRICHYLAKQYKHKYKEKDKDKDINKTNPNKGIGLIIAYASSLTYPFYLLHQNIGYSIISYMENKGLSGAILILIPTGIVLMLSIIIHEIVDKRLCVYLRCKLNV